MQSPRAGKNMAARTGSFGALNKTIAPFIRIIRAVVTTIGKMAEPALLQVLKRQTRRRGVVREHGGHFDAAWNVAQIHGGNPEPLNHIFHRTIFNPRDDALALPVFKPRRHVVTETMLLQKNGPMAVLTNVFGHPGKRSTTVSARRFHQ